MLTFIYRKILHLLVLLAAVCGLTFVLIKMSPIDPVSAFLGFESTLSPEQRDLIISQWGLNQSPIVQFKDWFFNFLKGDWGNSLTYHNLVKNVIFSRFWLSLALMGGAWILSGVFGFILGILAGLKENKLADKIISFYAYLTASTPPFWLAIILLSLFAVKFAVFPICCAGPLGYLASEITLKQKLWHLALPMLTLSIINISAIILHTREKTIQLFKTDFATLALAQGQSKLNFIFHQGFKHISIPAITINFASLGELFGGSVLAEQVFSYPGLGKATVEAGLKGDLPLLLAITLCSAIFIFFGNLMAEILYRVIDPRIKFSDITYE